MAVYATAAYGVLSIAQLDPRALAWSFDGKRQAVADGNRILLQADGTTEIIAGAAAPASPPSPSVAGTEQASMSHDGRFLVLQGAPVVYDLAQKARTELPPPIAGGTSRRWRPRSCSSTAAAASSCARLRKKFRWGSWPTDGVR